MTDPNTILANACYEPVRTAWAEAAQGVADGVIAEIRGGLQKHHDVVESIDLGGDPPSEWETRAERLLEYRKVVASELLEPLYRSVADGGVSRAIMERIARGVGDASVGAQALPEELSAPWPADALAAKPSDGWGRRVGKVLARGVSSARRAGVERPVPLRALAIEHVQQVVAQREDEALRRCLGLWAEWARQVELAWVEWGDIALPALVRSEQPDEEDFEANWLAARAAALELEARLEALVEEPPQATWRGLAEERLGKARELFDAEQSVSGSFLHRTEDRSPVAAPDHSPKRWSKGFEAWDDGVAARIRLYVSLLRVLAGATAVQRRLLWRFREKCLSSVDTLPSVADSLEGLASQESAASQGRLTEMRGRVARLLAPTGGALPTADVVNSTVSALSDSTVEALLAMVRQAPGRLDLHAENAKLPSATRGVDSRPLPVQQLARQSFDALRIERIRSSTGGLLEAIEAARASIGALPEVYAFADEAAVGELEEGEPEAEKRASSLIREALASMAESLRHEANTLESAVVVAQGRLAAEICEGSLAFLDRVAAGRMQAQLLAARSRLSDLRARLNQRWGPPVDRAARVMALRWRQLSRLVTRGVHKGTEIVGGASAQQGESARDIRALTDSDALGERIPLVYQRLFTLQPISDSALLAGRTTELGEAMARWKRWQSEDGVPIVIRGRPGSGVTSFLNVFCSSIEEAQGSVSRITLRERMTDEAALSRLLSESLGLPPNDTVAEVATEIFAAEPGALPQAVAVDDLEHLFLRVPGGTDLIERLLTLMSETEPRVFWIGGITTSAWQLVAAGEPTAVAQVDALELAPLKEGALREAITLRHRRSGLPIRYEESLSGGRMWRRRIRRLRDPNAYKAFLADDFFERLERASAGHIRLAFFLWLQAADFEAGDGVMMRSAVRPNFSVIESLDLTQHFTLKALLEHRTLNLTEHDRIFRLPRQESYQVLESLGNRHLIKVAATDRDQAQARSEVEGNLRYRIHPLLTGAVIAHLESRNIVH